MKILFAGGGTAGHIEPALAVARGWSERYPQDEIIFIGTDSGLENQLVPAAGYSLRHIPKVSISRKLSPSLLKVPFQLFASISKTMQLLKGVDCAIGFGGYVSGPMYCAAAITRTPFVIHEQNARPGWANKVGAYLTPFRALSYPVKNGALAKAVVTGLPLRRDVLEVLSVSASDWKKARVAAKKEIALRYGLDLKRPLIFVFGGSQGSVAINAVIEAAQPIFKSLDTVVIHGIGKNNPLPIATESYKPLNYINEMAQMYLASDLLISRSGAVTCAEAAALSKYSLFIPLPIGNGEQALNAQELISAGRAELLEQRDFSTEWIKENLPRLLERSEAQPESGDASSAKAVDKILEIIERAAKSK
jgi:UDP-N-acetylglucosamine--N-acetylmuramyl-(pentapeptide) pyrophosphoryl-undecaprenol N-acetylglucosamine transferase